ncbi:MAG: Coenzyme F420 hydrogenase/dehydrogenase, beta subunit C-terminal domain [Candidatus Hodarchaeales archaeon]
MKEGLSCTTTTGAKTCGTLGCCFDNCPMTLASKKNLNFAIFKEEPLDPDLGYYKKIVSARSTNIQIRNSAQDGGTVTSILAYLLSKTEPNLGFKGAIVTRRGENWKPTAFLATKPEEVLLSSGSIYSRLPLSSEIRSWFREKRNLIFVGTGCQITGLSLFQSNFLKKVPSDIFRIFRIGLFCFENFPYPRFKSAIEEKCGIKLSAIDKIDIDRGRLILYAKDGSISEQPIKNYNSIVPEACKLCTNFTSEFSDISVGSVGSEKGFNTLIIRSEEGIELIERAEDAGIIETTNKVFPEEIRKIIARKRKMSEDLTAKRKLNGLFLPCFN